MNELKYLPAIPGADPSKVILPCKTEWHLYVQVKCDEADERPQGTIEVGVAAQESRVALGNVEDHKFKTQVGSTGESPMDLALKGKGSTRFFLWAETADKEWQSEEHLEVVLDLDKKKVAQAVLGLSLARRLRLRQLSKAEPPVSPALPQAGYLVIKQKDFAAHKISGQ